METHQNALGTNHRTSERKKNERANMERNMMSGKEESEKKGIGMKRRSARIGIHWNGRRNSKASGRQLQVSYSIPKWLFKSE